MVFCETKQRVNAVMMALARRGYLVDELHGDLSQVQRTLVLKRFREAKLQILVATDIAARGLDIEGLTHVFNYDIPHDTEAYIHRIGRTGRAGRKGVAITLINPREYRQLRLIERLTKTKIVRRELPSPADILERQRDIVKEHLLKILAQGKYGDYHTIVSDVAADGDYDLVDVAAAALKLAVEGDKEPEETAEAGARFEDTGGAPGMVRLFLNIGRAQKIRPEDVVRAIASEADIPGNVIGVINIYERFTFVEVPEDVAERVLSVMHRNTMKGYKINVEPAKKSSR